MVLLPWLRVLGFTQENARQPWWAVSSRYLVHGITIIWFLHIQLLLLLDTIAVTVNPLVQLLPVVYYVGQSLPPLIILCVALIPPLATRFGRHLLAVTMVAMTLLPLIVTPLVLPTPQVGPLMDSSDTIALRVLPLHILSIIIVAWQYRWIHIVGVCLGSAIVLLIMNMLMWSQLPTGAVGLYVLVYLINGRCFSLLIGRIRDKTSALVQANQQLRHYANTLEQLTISRERNRMARELHDTLAHTLADLTVQIETAKAYVRVNPETTCDILQTALVSARSGLQETRRSLKSLRASPLEELGLAAALRELAQMTVEEANLQLEMTIDTELPTLPPDSEQAIYRIAQEALANVKYHAGAKHLNVSLTATNRILHLLVRDDGRGFQTHKPIDAGHYGLAGMAEWAHVTGGHVKITSALNQGTTIYAEIGD